MMNRILSSVVNMFDKTVAKIWTVPNPVIDMNDLADRVYELNKRGINSYAFVHEWSLNFSKELIKNGFLIQRCYKYDKDYTGERICSEAYRISWDLYDYMERGFLHETVYKEYRQMDLMNNGYDRGYLREFYNS